MTRSINSILHYKGSLTNINGLNDPYGCAAVLGQYDDVIITYPFTSTSVGTITAPSNRDFINVISVANRSVWVDIDLAPSSLLTTAALAVTQAKALMDFIYSQFLSFGISNLLAGFHFQHFGYYSTTYSDNSIMDRQQQNQLIDYAHVNYGLPVAISTQYPSDLFAALGPNTRSASPDNNVPLQPCSLGRWPAVTDMLLVYDVLWNHTTGLVAPANLLEAVNLLSNLQKYSLRVVGAQLLDLSSSASDGILGLNIDTATLGKLRNAANLLASAGFSDISFSDLTVGNGSNFVIYPTYYLPNPQFLNGAGANASLYSREGFVYTQYLTTDVNGNVVTTKDCFNGSDYSYVSSVSQ